MTNSFILKIKPFAYSSEDFYKDYHNFHHDDAGVDLFVLETIVAPARSQVKLKFGIATECLRKTMSSDNDEMMIQNVGYFLAPRSSISKTPLRMSNSMGIIDAGYRGELIAVCDNISDQPYGIEKGVRLFQILNTDLVSFKEVIISENLSDTSRGSGGFGSTNDIVLN